MTQNTNDKQPLNKKKKIIVVVVGLIAAGTVTAMMLSGGNKTAEQKAANVSNQQQSNILTAMDNQEALNSDVVGEERDKIDIADAKAASEAEAANESHISTLPNSQKETETNASDFQASNPNLVNLPPNMDNNLNNNNTNTMNSQPQNDAMQVNPENFQNQQMVPVDNTIPPVPEKSVYVVTERKEIPVLRYKPYKFTQDEEVKAYFIKQYGGNLPNVGNSQQNEQQGGQGGQTVVANKFTHMDLGKKHRDIVAQKESQKTIQNQQIENNNITQQNNNAQNTTTTPAAEKVVLAKIGDILPAELETNIDSRQPTLVRAKIVGGKLKGSIIVGSFQKNGDGTSLLIEFKTLNHPDSKESIPFNAVAVDYSTGSNAMVSDYNRHIVARISFQTLNAMANAFAQNLSTNNQSSNQRTIVDESTGKQTTIQENKTTTKSTKDILKESGAVGLSTSMQEFSDLVPNSPTVKVNAMPFGLFITEDLVVTKEQANEMNLFDY